MTNPHRHSPLSSRHTAILATLCLVALNACTGLPVKQAQRPPQGDAESLAVAERCIAAGLKDEKSRKEYAAAVSRLVETWQSAPGEPTRQKSLTILHDGQPVRITASWPEAVWFDELIPTIPTDKRKFERAIVHEGVGVLFIAQWRRTEERKKAEPLLSEVGYLTPVTVTLDFKKGQKGTREAILHIHDRRFQETALIAGRRHPLVADFSAVGEWVVHQAEVQESMSPLAALTHSNKYLDKLGLLALDPPSRDRIPLIFIHGLMSRPLTWHNAVNELAADPVIRKKYQIFFFRYPTGVPVLYSSNRFRQELAKLHQELIEAGNHEAAHRMVLIGHSMGGLVSKLQLMDSGDRIWLTVFGKRPTEMKLSPKELAGLKEFMEFRPNPYVDRVIFICTPHRGSNLAEGFVGAVARRLVSLPLDILGSTLDLLQGEAADNPAIQAFLDRGVPSSIENLSPESDFVEVSMKIPLRPGLHIHSIVGNKDGRSLTDPKCSDGVVLYSSAHLDGVESELVVNANHSAHATKEGIAEIKRILLLHLKSR